MRMRNVWLLCLVFFGFITCSESEQSSSEKSTRKSDELVVVMDMSFPPFEGIDTEGKPYGISVDLAHDLGAFLGKKVRINNVKWEGLIPSLQTHQSDMILSSMSVTADRAEVVDFSMPYGQLGIELVTRKDFLFANVSSLNDPKMRINVRKGTVSDIVGSRMFAKSQLVKLLDYDSSVLEILQNKVDIVLMDPLSAFQYQKQYKNELAVHYRSLGVADMAIAVRKTTDRKFLDRINKFLEEYKNDGRMDILVEKYLGDVKREMEKQNREFKMLY